MQKRDIEKRDIVGNKAKGRTSKRMLQENKASQIFRKTNISYVVISTCTCVLSTPLTCILNLGLRMSSARRQKGVSRQSAKRAKISKKQKISYPLYAHVVRVSGGKKCSFFRKFGVLCFIVTYVLRFALLPCHRRI